MGLFRFKQFSLDDSHCPMKIGTDAVLLGAWAPLPSGGCVLDIGCGCGIIAMMLAQRNPELIITGIDIHPEAARQASANASMNPLAQNVTFFTGDVRELALQGGSRFDLIVSNPPYFQASLKGRCSARNHARHDLTLSFCELTEAASRLLTPEGSFSVIIPTGAYPQFKVDAASAGLFPQTILQVSHHPDSDPVRTLVCFTRERNPSPGTTSISIRNHDNDYSGEYLSLTSPFYLFA
jgi:tRNA1Val (adenine37-N6)-methyltransferase